jgi:hypothetical protein
VAHYQGAIANLKFMVKTADLIATSINFHSSPPYCDDCPPLRTSQRYLLICRTCSTSHERGARPRESLTNYRWIGAIPPELQDLTWIKELLIARSHLVGQIVPLQNRNASSHFSLKGHVFSCPRTRQNCWISYCSRRRHSPTSSESSGLDDLFETMTCCVIISL